MLRLESVSRAIREGIPPELLPVFGAVTALGGATFLLVALSLAYWLDDRRAIATVVSYAFLALALVVVLKTAIGLPRPPESVRVVATSDPYGFPSGHAVAAVVVYGGLALAHDRFDATDPATLAAVGVIVALVALSRVALGVHYLGDVIAGTVLGAALLVALWRLVGREPARAFALAAVVSVPALLLTNLGSEAVLAFGGSLGGAAGSLRIDSVPSPRSYAESGTLVLVGVPGAFALDTLGESVAAVFSVVVYAVLVAGILLLPALVGRVPLWSGRKTSVE
ncbi:MAG: phosphatase PAP2 family protein [Haloarculaceae archaeon]